MVPGINQAQSIFQTNQHQTAKVKQLIYTVNQCNVQSTINSIEPSILQNTQVSLQQATKLNLINLHFSLKPLHLNLKIQTKHEKLDH